MDLDPGQEQLNINEQDNCCDKTQCFNTCNKPRDVLLQSYEWMSGEGWP